MKTVIVLLDSLNRHYLSCYGNAWTKTPCIDAFAARSTVFDNHWLGSAPCMPARRDIMTGRYCFLERGWGGMEPFDLAFPEILNQAGIHTHIETDHHHYFNGGGEFYMTHFASWRGHRGQVSDPTADSIILPKEPEHLGKWEAKADLNLARYKTDADFPTPRTFAGAIDWLQINENTDDWLLMVEGFDPHEPFHCPDEFLSLYDDDWQGPRYDWSGYDRVDPESDATRHLQRHYAACLSMTDRWFGKLIDELDRQGLFEDTLIMLTTDHGHLLGEHGVTGKNNWHCWNEVARLPLVVSFPGNQAAGERRRQLTQNLDLMPTALDHCQIERPENIHGHSFLAAANDPEVSIRQHALYGWFGSAVNVTDGQHTYFRAPATTENGPLFEYFLMPTSFHNRFRVDHFKEAEFDRFLPHVDCPVLRRPRPHPMRADDERLSTCLFNVIEDPGQMNPLTDQQLHGAYEQLLIIAMQEAGAPREQFQRMGLVPTG